MSGKLSSSEILSLTTEIVSSHVANNSVAVSDLPALIEQVHATMTSLATKEEEAAKRPEPAVPVRKSVTPDYIVCLEDGKKLKMLKRHLMTNYDMSPDEYREKWGLNADYPMVAPNYAKQRSELAKRIGLGKKGR